MNFETSRGTQFLLQITGSYFACKCIECTIYSTLDARRQKIQNAIFTNATNETSILLYITTTETFIAIVFSDEAIDDNVCFA